MDLQEIIYKQLKKTYYMPAGFAGLCARRYACVGRRACLLTAHVLNGLAQTPCEPLTPPRPDPC